MIQFDKNTSHSCGVTQKVTPLRKARLTIDPSQQVTIRGDFKIEIAMISIIDAHAEE